MFAVLDKAETFVQTGVTIEIVIASGSTKKLQKYKRKGVPEVWFWQKGKFTLHQLQDGEYIQIPQSEALKGIDLSLLGKCMMLDSKLEAVKTFRSSLRS